LQFNGGVAVLNLFFFFFGRAVDFGPAKELVEEVCFLKKHNFALKYYIMKKQLSLVLFIASLLGSSCTVTNSVYLNDASPLGIGELELNVGAGTGFEPAIDSVDDAGRVFFTDKVKLAPAFFMGGQYGLTDKGNIRFALHLPYGFGGFGLRGGGQYSLLPKASLSNIAFGGDLGLTLSKDSLTLFGSAQPIDKETNGAFTGNGFMTFTYTIKPEYRVNLTTRYNFNAFFIRDNIYEDKTSAFKTHYPSVSLGLRLKKMYFEGSLLFYEHVLVPQFGVAFVFSPRPEEYYTN
jgi:hypothetical protein